MYLSFDNHYQTTHDKYKVYHIKPGDQSCNLHLLAHNEDDSEQLLIPVEKDFLVNSKYTKHFFGPMFRETSNFREATIFANNDDNNGNNDNDKPIIKIQVEKPLKFGEYLGMLYGKKVSLTVENCVDFYKIADYLLDKLTVEVIFQFINNNSSVSVSNKNLPSETINQLAEYSEIFDDVIVKHVENRLLSNNEIFKLGKITDRFDKLVSNYFEKNEAENRVFEEKSKAQKVNLTIKLDKSYNLFKMVSGAVYDKSAIEMSVENKKIIFKDNEGPRSLKSIEIIFAIKGIKSFKVTPKSDNKSIMAGWTENESIGKSSVGILEKDTKTVRKKSIYHSGKSGKLYYDRGFGFGLIQKSNSNEIKIPSEVQTPEIIWSCGTKSNQHIIVRKEQDYYRDYFRDNNGTSFLSWSQELRTKETVRHPCSKFGLTDVSNLYPKIMMFTRGSSVEISNVEFENEKSFG